MKMGDIIHFGEYNWRVLDIYGDTALLITEDIIEQRAYHSIETPVTWENCGLREYLNSEFYDRFSQADKARIIAAANKNPENQWYGTAGGKDTRDKIFLLSLEEADKYFGDSGDYLNKRRKSPKNNKRRKFIPNINGHWLSNAYDKERMSDFEGYDSWWWLRSPGGKVTDAACVGFLCYGGIFVNGVSVDGNLGGVRPALWVK